MTSPVNLTSTAAVQSNGDSYLFFAKAQGNIGYLKSVARQAHHEQGKRPYESSNIIIKEDLVTANTKSPQIAAVAYKRDQKHEIRVYYISEKGKLCEICRTDGGEWYRGSLTSAGTSASPTSLLTATVDYFEHGQLKLYYNQTDDTDLWCTWVNMGDEHWSTEALEVIKKK